MVITRVLQTRTCAGCRSLLLRSFTSSTVPSPCWQWVPSERAGRSISYQVRYSSTIGDRASEKHGKDESTEAESLHDDPIEDAEEAEIEEHTGGKQVAPVPWYLQVDSPRQAIKPLSERQIIPDLPVDPPPILKPLLQQISIDLGLDDLSLLDLRKLDPPPALGANLLMILGTARSEKHLHVSADRLCRWLRSTFKLRPDADGLLGRNELKLKLKRKAKRAKLLGSANDESGDDGVRTGWVCVDVGVVDGDEAPLEPQSADFVGFGRRTDGVRIVVQMLTEEKREEIDLEKLWGGILKRGGIAEIEVDESESRDHSPAAQKLTTGGTQTTNFSPILSQTRRFHTSARRLSPELRAGLMNDSGFMAYSNYDHEPLHEIHASIQKSFASRDFERARTDLQAASERDALLQNDEWRPFLLHNLRTYLDSLPEDMALAELGAGSTDKDSTPFLKCFYQTLTSFPSQTESEAVLWLFCSARFCNHPGYTVDALLELFEEIQVSGVKVGLKSYLELLRAILHQDLAQRRYGPSQHALSGTMQVLQAMDDQGLSVLDEQILLQLQSFTAPGKLLDEVALANHTKSPKSFDIPSVPLIPVQKRLHLLMTRLPLPLFSEKARISLLHIYARQYNWVEFWEIWNLAPLHGEPRSSELYTNMFILIAHSGNQKASMNALRMWLPEMALEQPSIPLEGNVARSVQYCLKIADPNVERDANSDSEAVGEWASLWRNCQMQGRGRASM